MDADTPQPPHAAPDRGSAAVPTVAFDPDALTRRRRYKLLSGTVVPRPIGWISTRDEAGRSNLAPYSFFNVVSADPPTVVFSAGRRDGSPKDSAAIAESTGVFVVNLVDETVAEAMNASAIDAPRGVDEFGIAGVTPVDGDVVPAPRVAESPVAFECRVSHVVPLEPGPNRVIFGRVVRIHVRDDLLVGDHGIDVERLRPVGRLAGGAYARLGEIFTLERPSWDEADGSTGGGSR